MKAIDERELRAKIAEALGWTKPKSREGPRFRMVEAPKATRCRCNCGCKNEVELKDGRRQPLCADCYRSC